MSLKTIKKESGMRTKKHHLDQSLEAFVVALRKCKAATLSMKSAVERMRHNIDLLRGSALAIMASTEHRGR